MKKETFIVIFILICVGFMYSPLPKVSGAAQKECFQGAAENLFEVSQLPKEIPVEFFYNNARTNWKILGEQSGITLIAKNINNNILFTQNIKAKKSDLSTNKCEFYSFEFERNSGVLNYELPLTKEGTDSDGRKTCFYALANSVVDEIASLGGGSITSLQDICPELVKGKIQTEGNECAPTATCTINIRKGDSQKFAIAVEKDMCSPQKELIYELNNKNEISAELEEKAREFISRCEKGEGQGSKLINVNPVVGGSGNSGTPTGNNLGCKGPSAIGCTNSQQTNSETYCETSGVSFSPGTSGAKGCLCGDIKNPKSSSDCGAGTCVKGGSCNFVQGGWLSSNKCECQRSAQFPTQSGKGFCKPNETPCGFNGANSECCKPGESCNSFNGNLVNYGFCYPSSCPAENPVECAEGYTQPSKTPDKFKVCCPSGTKCSYHLKTGTLLDVNNAYCTKTTCGVGETQCGTDQDLKFSSGEITGKLCCAGKQICVRLEKSGYFSYKCSDTLVKCGANEELCVGGDNFVGKDKNGNEASYSICCPKGTCLLHSDGAPTCR